MNSPTIQSSTAESPTAVSPTVVSPTKTPSGELDSTKNSGLPYVESPLLPPGDSDTSSEQSQTDETPKINPEDSEEQID